MLIAEDLVSALSHLEHVKTGSFVVRMPDARTRFDLAVERSLIRNGFTIKNLNYSAGGSLLTTVMDRKIGSNEYTLLLMLDQLALKRSYVIDEQHVEPITSLFVNGVSSVASGINEGVYLRENG